MPAKQQDIIEGIRKGDQEVERSFYLSHKTQCVRYAAQNFFWKGKNGENLKCGQDDAEELYNDACVLFIQNVLKGRIGQLEAKLSSYLITSMRYLWFNKARAKKPKPVLKVEESQKEVKEAIRMNVRNAIGQLDDKCREMMTYRYILGWEDYEDIAKVTGKNNGDVVRNLISRCRKRFREHYVQLTKLSGV